MAAYIIFDLEFMFVRKQQQHLADIIEIGAIKMVEHEGVPLMNDLFHSYVKPGRQSRLTPETTKFTDITQEQADQAPTFSEMLASFKEWLGEEPYFLCTWGPDDKYQLLSHCRHYSEPMDWLRNYNDLQLLFTQLYDQQARQRYGLTRALDALEISFLGQQHHALDDAFNTAKIFSTIFSRIQLETNQASEEDLYASQVVYSTGQEENHPFLDLAKLLGMAQ